MHVEMKTLHNYKVCKSTVKNKKKNSTSKSKVLYCEERLRYAVQTYWMIGGTFI